MTSSASTDSPSSSSELSVLGVADRVDFRQRAQSIPVDTAVRTRTDVDRASTDYDTINRPDVIESLGQHLGAAPKLNRAARTDHDAVGFALG